ncbi:hypothetical protein NESM_000590800 [Novymonas esmeraldas]|uniref:Uncharacterized protein n=1 Tax=Novymonas esmeraldas TaxID=1808958 RepID=A0AAW0ESB2_9TRYP
MCAAVAPALGVHTPPLLRGPLAKPREVQETPAPVAHSRFTVSYANRAAPSCAPSPVELWPVREDAELQRSAVEAERRAELSDFILRQEKAGVISEADRRASTLMLLNCAARRDINEARRAGYPEQVIDFMHQTWVAFIQQAKDFYLFDTEVPATVELSRSALENISSIGVWFTGPQMSLPLRRYTVQVIGADGTPQNITAVGLLSFAYSSYVMQLRAMSQQSMLEALTSMQEQLGTASLFLPQLLVASS